MRGFANYSTCSPVWGTSWLGVGSTIDSKGWKVMKIDDFWSILVDFCDIYFQNHQENTIKTDKTCQKCLNRCWGVRNWSFYPPLSSPHWTDPPNRVKSTPFLHPLCTGHLPAVSRHISNRLLGFFLIIFERWFFTKSQKCHFLVFLIIFDHFWDFDPYLVGSKVAMTS